MRKRRRLKRNARPIDNHNMAMSLKDSVDTTKTMYHPNDDNM
ncbi:MAG TPA: hypothetical protein VJ903_05760 [Clostridia bacterium]|nr:hypothetical protein [Clostridia bacterium]